MTSAILLGIFASLNRQRPPITEARARATPHTVPQPGLTRRDLGDEAFEAAMEERRLWIMEHCRFDHMIEPLRKGARDIVGSIASRTRTRRSLLGCGSRGDTPFARTFR
jgi:hypothetical protein